MIAGYNGNFPDIYSTICDVMCRIEIILRPLLPDDAKVSWRWRNDADVWKYTFNRPDRLITEKMEKEWIMKVLNDENRCNFAICVKETRLYIGNAYLNAINGESASFGIFIGEKKYWGKGIGTEVTRQVLEYAFKKLHLKRVKLGVKADNVAGIKAYMKAGFRKKTQDGDNVWMMVENSSHD